PYATLSRSSHLRRRPALPGSPRCGARVVARRAQDRHPAAVGCDGRVDMTTLEPTVAAVVREQTGLPWSRARSLCAEGRVTVDGERWLDAALRVPPGATVVVDAQAPKRRER